MQARNRDAFRIHPMRRPRHTPFTVIKDVVTQGCWLGVGLPYLMLGSVSNVWNGGGEDSVHSSVVAPAPQGLSAAFWRAMK